METQTMTVPVGEIRANDRFTNPDDGAVQWTAIRDAELIADDVVLLRVRFADGGDGTREWRNASKITLAILRGAQ